MIGVMYPKSRLTMRRYSVSAKEASAMFKKRAYSWLVILFEPSAMFVGTDSVDLRTWEISPYLSF